jgi:hypothetical protein
MDGGIRGRLSHGWDPELRASETFQDLGGVVKFMCPSPFLFHLLIRACLVINNIITRPST